MTPTIDTRGARRLALAKAGLLKPRWTGLTDTAGRGSMNRRTVAHDIIRRFGYLQLDTVSIAGARSHSLVLLSRLRGLPSEFGEQLLKPGEPLFEYWGHEASWMPIELYPVFAFRRRGMGQGSWWKRMMEGNRTLARQLVKRIKEEGPLKSADLEGKDGGGWWAHKPAKRVAVALWTSGELAISERSNFHRTFDLAERVIPERYRKERVSRRDALRELMRIALEGHGWATTGTLASTWRFRNIRKDLDRALSELQEAGGLTWCTLKTDEGREIKGWISPKDLELAERLRGIRPNKTSGILLSPFDPVLWDRKRVTQLFRFDQILEIFKPAPERKYGYFCLPVLAGESLIARVDLKADRANGRLHVFSRRFESTGTSRPGNPAEQRAYGSALDRFSESVRLAVVHRRK